MTKRTRRGYRSPAPHIRILQYSFKADFFKALGHPLRIRIIDALRGGPLTVNELRLALGVEQSTLSQQLAVLRVRNFIAGMRTGSSIRYSVTDPALWRLLDAALEIFQNQVVSVKVALEDIPRDA